MKLTNLLIFYIEILNIIVDVGDVDNTVLHQVSPTDDGVAAVAVVACSSTRAW